MCERWYATKFCERWCVSCEIAPRLPRETTKPSQALDRHSAMNATPATQNEGGCEIVPHLPRKTMVDVSLCYVCDRWYVTKLCVKFVYVKDGL